MKRNDFNNAYENAKAVDVRTNEWFNTMGWFWLNLTEKQLQKMWDLLIEQNNLNPLTTSKIGFANGMVLSNPRMR